jgi:hypothetical protein
MTARHSYPRMSGRSVPGGSGFAAIGKAGGASYRDEGNPLWACLA